MELDIRHCLYKAKEHRDSEALQSAYRLITRTREPGTTGRIDPELILVCAEAALQLGCLEESAVCLKMFFEGNPPANQFLCRAYLCQGQIKTPAATGTVDDFKGAILSFLEAIEVAKSVPGCSFIVFNASVLYFQSVRPLLQTGRCHHLVQSLRQVVQSLEEVAHQDHSWRAELMMHLIRCLVDSGNVEDAASFAEMTEEFIKSHTPHLHPSLFTLQVRHMLMESEVLIKKSRQSSTLTVIYKIQDIKKLEKMNEDKSKKEELEQIFNLLKQTEAHVDSSSPQSSTPIQPANRVAFLLELALLALQLKHQKVAADCLKELKSAGEASNGQRIIMECVNCEINVQKTEAKINDYSKASVEARLKEIGKLDQCLQTAVKERDPQAMQAVCATQWGLCLPLLQNNLRKRIKAPLLRVSQVLEDVQSMLLELRCQVHLELVMIEEEEGRLEAALTHLQKASLMDNGTQRERLSTALHLLQLRGSLKQTPARAEDKASMLLQQTRDMKPQDKAGIRPILVTVGLLLAPEDFQMVLDADNTTKIPVGSPGSGPAAQLCAKAQHHSACVQKADGHLDRQRDDTDDTERMKLWATLVKTARKQDVWDVCRAACRFCLLYDDGRWKISNNANKTMNDAQTYECQCSEEESSPDWSHSSSEGQTHVKDLLLLLAETHFISAESRPLLETLRSRFSVFDLLLLSFDGLEELSSPQWEATVHKLLTEGVQLNSTAVPAVGVCVSEEDPHWAVYRDWIQALSAYATSSILRAAELGAEIGESWVLANAAVYLWNYSTHLLAVGEYQHLLPAFQSLVEMLRETEYTGSRALFMLLCDAVARGLIQPLCGLDSAVPTPLAEKNCKQRAEKGKEKAANTQGVHLGPAVLQNVHKASEVCDYALRLAACSNPGESVPIAVMKRLVSTWVQIKRLLQQQIDSKTDNKYECESEESSAMRRVLVGVEMLQCNRNPRHMEFSVPSLSTLVSSASECIWTDAVVELQVWCQLAAFCHDADEHSLVLFCTERALQREEEAEKSLNAVLCVLYGPTAVNEMLSIAACLKGQSLVQQSKDDMHAYKEALRVFISAISFAEKAESPALCVAAARHYWNTCLPLTLSPEERWRLQEPLEKIVTALVQTTNKHKEGKGKDPLISTALGSKHEAAGEEELTLRAAIYSLLLRIHIDKADWKSALQLLDQAVKHMPSKRNHLPLLKQQILVKAQLGESVQLDMKKLQDEGEQCCSSMWHQVALCVGTISQQLSCYQKSITSLMSPETRLQKVSLLLEFGEWLYCHNFPKADSQIHIQWAIDILLQRDGDESKKRSVKCESPVGLNGMTFTHSLSDLKEVRRLDSLVRAHTLFAVMADKTSPDHQLNLLRAYTFVLQMWQVSMKVCCEISIEAAKAQPSQPPPSAGSKKGKDKGKGKKGKDPPPAEEKAKPVILDQELPSTLKDWARFICPEAARQIFRTNRSQHCINTHSVTKQTQSLFYLNLLEKELTSLSLEHLTLPIMHLAETIAHDLLDKRSLSDLYRLRIVRLCCQLGLEAHSNYHPELQSLSTIPEQEQMDCRRQIAVPRERRGLHKNDNQVIWLDKAEVCKSMGLFQQARQLMDEALFVSTELGDQRTAARSLLSQSALACEEQNFSQALLLLDKAKDLGGDEDFWYQLTLTKVTAVVGQKDEDSQMKVDQVIKEGCGALKLVLEQRINKGQELTFFITSLQMRGAIESARALVGGEPGENLCNKAVQKLLADCDTLRECARVFSNLNYRQQAAEAHVESVKALRILASSTSSTDDRQRFLLDGLSLMQLAVTEQEHVVLNAQQLLSSEEESAGLSLVATRRLQRLRLDLAEFSLAVLEEKCTEEKHRALAREKKTLAEIALEEFTRCTPEPDSVEQEWSSTGSTAGQVALGQLAAVRSQSPETMESRAQCLSLMGKYLRLLAVQEEPISLCALWDPRKQTGAQSDVKAASVEEEVNSEEERDSESGRRETSMTPARSAELQQRRGRACKLLEQATQALTEAITLCLRHKLPTSILAGASLNMLECHGQSNPAVAGQYLALYQSCCTVATMANVLSSTCFGNSDSQLSALLSLHKKLLLSQEERPTSMLKGVEESLNSLSKTFSHLTINPSHLNILAEIPPNLRILLLQHSEDSSELFGAFYEITETWNQKGKTVQGAGTLTCSRVAKVSVCPQALLALRERTQAFGQEARLTLFKEACWQSWHTDKDELKRTADEMLTPHFSKIIQDMDNYLKPILTQFDFSFLRSQSASLPVLETRTKDKEEKESTVKSAADQGQFLVLLADKKLLELPLEALTILQQDGLTSVSRDFSLQLLHSRLNREESQKVESDNKKETKGGKGAKGKVDQSLAIKVGPENRVLPSNIIPVDARNFKYIVDIHNEGNFEGTSLSSRMGEILETHSQHLTHLWEGFMGSKQTPSLSEIQQLLSRCSALMYLGMERFTGDVPPGKLAALNLSECRMALLFDLVQNKASMVRQTNLDMHKSAGQLALEKPLETALLLSMAGVSCVCLNQWHSSLQQNTHRLVHVLDNLLRVRLTSGQTVHALRREESSEMRHHELTGPHDQLTFSDLKNDDVRQNNPLKPSSFNVILYGLPNLITV